MLYLKFFILAFVYLWRQIGGEMVAICNVLISALIYAFEHCYNWFIIEIWNSDTKFQPVIPAKFVYLCCTFVCLTGFSHWFCWCSSLETGLWCLFDWNRLSCMSKFPCERRLYKILNKKIPKSIPRICLHQIGGDYRAWEFWCFKSMVKVEVVLLLVWA